MMIQKMIDLLFNIYQNVDMPENIEREVREAIAGLRFVTIRKCYGVIRKSERKNGVVSNDNLTWQELADEPAVLMAFVHLRGVGTEFDVIEGEHLISTGGCLYPVPIRVKEAQ